MADELQSFSCHIKNVCGLQVAVRGTTDVDEICRKNYLSFCEMLRPFSQLSAETQLPDPSGHLYSIRDLRIRFSEPRPCPTPRSTVEQLLSETIHWSERGGVDVKPSGSTLKFDGMEIPATCPWFEHYAECYHDNMQVLEHEYFRHYLAVVLVVSTRHARPVEAFQSLYQVQKESEKESYPYWLASPHIYYYHILLHDTNEGDNKHAKESFDQLKSIYGSANCYFLSINSVDPTLIPNSTIPEPWSGFLRIPSSPNVIGQEENDFSFKRFRQNKAKSSPSQTPPKSHDNHTPLISNNSIEVLPAVVEGEVKVMYDQLDKSSSSTSIEVELGDEPLTSQDEVVTTSVSIAVDIPRRQVRVGECLGLIDQNNLRNCVKEFSSRLLPHLAAVLKKINDSLQSRRTMSRRVSSFSRGLVWKMMGGTSGAGNSTSGSSTSKNIEDSNLGPDSIERLMRLVGDIAFLLQNYELSYNMHHTLKRDLQGKELWIHYAGALEMAALSAQLMGQTRKEVQQYLEEASQIYLKNLSMSEFALRASLFLCDILKERSRYRELSQQFIKMINEESDLRSALCLEQAAHSFLRVSPKMIRKYAFHLILAGHHFSRSGQKYHSVRAYKQSLAVYEHKGWTIAEDYANFSCGRLCFSLQLLDKAHLSLESLLSHESFQTSQQQMSNLRDYIYVKRMLYSQTKPIQLSYPYSSSSNNLNLSSVSQLPLPFVKPQLTVTIFDNGITNKSPSHDTNSTNTSGSVVIGGLHYDPSKSKFTESLWQTLEKSLTGDSHQVVLYMNEFTDNDRTPLCPINEFVKVGVVLKNTLSVPLLMRNVTLTWNFTPFSNQDSNNDAISCEVMGKFILTPRAQEMIELHVLPCATGNVTITGLLYNICDNQQDDVIINDIKSGNVLHDEGFQGRIDFHCKGRRLNSSKVDRLGVVYGEDNRLCWKIVNPMPRIMITIDGLNYPLLAGEVIKLSLTITNCSDLPVTNIRMNSSLHHCMLLQQNEDTSNNITNDKNTLHSILSIVQSSSSFITLYTNSLLAGESINCQLLVHTPISKLIEVPLNMSFYYEPTDSNNTMKYRLLRHSEILKIQSSLQVNVTSTHCMSPDYKYDILLAIEFENCSGSLGKLLNFKITQLTSISYSWKLQRIDQENEILLTPSEVGVAHVRGSRELNVTHDKLLVSDVSFGNRIMRTDSFPLKDFLKLSESYQQLMNSIENKILLIVHWEGYTSDTNLVHSGHHYITVTLPQATPILNIPHPQSTTPIFSSPSPYDLVRHTLNYPTMVSHDFTTNQICSIPVSITIDNCTSQSVDIIVELLSTSEVAIGMRSLEMSFHWFGPSKTSFTLPSLSDRTITVYATFLSPGIYCLNSFRVKAALSNSTMHHQRWQVPSYLTVNNVGGD